MTRRFEPPVVPVLGSGSNIYVPTRAVDPYRKSGHASSQGENIVGWKEDDVSVQFQYNISALDVNTVTSGTGATSHSASTAIASSGTGVGDSSIESLHSVVHRPGHEVVAGACARFSTGEVNTKQQVGLFNGSDGFSFGMNEGTFGVFRLDAGSETFIPSTAFSHDKLNGGGSSKFTITPTNLNTYQITFDWGGLAYFSVYGGADKGWVLAHVIDLTNSLSAPIIRNPTLPMKTFVERTSGTGADLQVGVVYLRAGIVTGAGEDKSSLRFFMSERESVTVPAGLGTPGAPSSYTPLISLRSAANFQGLANHVRAQYATVTLTTDGTKSVLFRVFKNVTLTGASYTPIDAANSTVLRDTSATAIVSGTLVGGIDMGKEEQTRTNLLQGDVSLSITSGESICFAAKSQGSSDVTVLIRHVEYF